jgi:hypothetical protein
MVIGLIIVLIIAIIAPIVLAIKGDLWDFGAGSIFGFDYCFWPNGAKAYGLTISTSYGVYGGYDYYWLLD